MGIVDIDDETGFDEFVFIRASLAASALPLYLRVNSILAAGSEGVWRFL